MTEILGPAFDSNDIGILAYRLNNVESEIKNLRILIERVLSEYPTASTVNSITDTLKERIEKLEEENKNELVDKIKSHQQAKFLMAAAIAGPIITFLMSAVLFYLMTGGIPYATSEG